MNYYVSLKGLKPHELKKYLALYYEEDYLFDVVGPAAVKRGYLHFDEFYSICSWKSRRRKDLFSSSENKKNIERVTKAVFKEQEDDVKMKNLIELDGVGIPMASAILTVLFPNKYAVIDVRCVEILGDHGYEVGSTQSISGWCGYLTIMRELAEKNHVTPREMDMVLYAMSREKSDAKKK